MIKLIASLLIASCATFGLECERSFHEKEKAFTVVCELEHQGERMEFISGKGACEFPEGTPVDCAYAVSCENGKSPRRGSSVFRKGSALEDFCITAPDVPGPKERLIGQSRSRKGRALLKCPVKLPLTIELAIGEKSQQCNFNF